MLTTTSYSFCITLRVIQGFSSKVYLLCVSNFKTKLKNEEKCVIKFSLIIWRFSDVGGPSKRNSK